MRKKEKKPTAVEKTRLLLKTLRKDHEVLYLRVRGLEKQVRILFKVTGPEGEN